MKKYLYLFFALCVGAVVMSCKPNNDINDPNKYVVMAKLHSMGNSFENEKIAESYDKIVAAMKEGGYAPGEKVEIHISDTAQMIADLKAFAKKVKSDVGSISGYFQIELTGCQSVYADKNDKDHPWKLYDMVSIGNQPNEDKYVLHEYFAKYVVWWGPFHTDLYYRDAWVYGIKTNSRFDGDTEDSHAFDVNVDLNAGAGGDYIYPVMITDGHGNWKSSTKYITDLIAVYGGGEPKELKINGRTYRKACPKDLNDGAEGKYIWFYATYDYYDGRYLWLGGDEHEESGNTGCRVLYKKENKDFSAANALKQPWNANGYDVVERVVPAYSTTGQYLEEADFNRGAGGWTIKMICAYRKHN